MEHHNKQVDGTERLFRFQAAHYRVGTEFDDFIYRGQLVQAEALKTAVEHWRRRKFGTAGSLFWQLNDCWPVSSWAVIDSSLRPKAAYYFAKKFFAPVLVSFRRTRRGIEVWGTNDLLRIIPATVKISLRSFSGKIVWQKSLRIRLRGNGSRRLAFIATSTYERLDSSTHYLSAALIEDAEVLSENRLFFLEPKHLQIPVPRISTKMNSRGKGEAILTVRSSSLVKNIRLEVEGNDAVFEDNYFDLDARSTRRLMIRSALNSDQLRKKLRLKWLI
jgi:beta-mannosidase